MVVFERSAAARLLFSGETDVLSPSMFEMGWGHDKHKDKDYDREEEAEARK